MEYIKKIIIGFAMFLAIKAYFQKDGTVTSLRALLKNSNENERWEAYKKENETAIQNLQEFSKHLSVEVMVPIGKKAFMPGELIHTNEVLVGHYQGYFSKCSAHKAIEICELRLNQAKDHLNKLQAEEEFWQNKLDKPYLEGVLPNADERDILEEYDENNEKLWREKHKEMLKRAKLLEKSEREQEAKKAKKTSETSEEPKSDEDIFKMLEEAEIMEELEKELESLEIDEVSDETIRKLISGEMEMPKQKARKANESKLTETIKETTGHSLNGVVKKIEHDLSKEKPPATNNNSQSNPEIQMDESLTDDDNEFTAEAQLIKEEAAFLPVNDQVGFYEYQVEIIRKKVAKFRMRSESDINKKLHLLTVQSELEDLLALAIEEMDIDQSGNESNMDLSEEQVENEDPTNKPKEAQQQKRRISFALENETLIFRDNEAVSQMLPKEDLIDEEKETRKRDRIALDNDDALRKSVEHIELQSLRDKKQDIIERVKKNRQFVVEEQSQVYSDLVTQIIDEADSNTKTIFIPFKHSEQQAAEQNDNDSSPNKLSEEIFIPGKPSDFYDLYLKQLAASKEISSTQSSSIYLNGYVGEENVKAPILKEAYRQNAYEDPRSKFSIPNSDYDEDEESSVANKSILRNKSAVEQETHLTSSPCSKNQRKTKAFVDEGEYMSAYYKVMNEVIEKPPMEPDPLPQQKFIDAHAPKKRISRFKQSRKEAEKT